MVFCVWDRRIFSIGARMLGFGGPTWNFSLFSFWSSLCENVVQSTGVGFPVQT